MAGAVLYPAARNPSAPAAEAASTSPAVEGPPAIGATTTGHRASRWRTSAMRLSVCPSDPAPEPHPGHPGGERDRLASENGIHVVEVRDDRKQVAAGHRRTGHPPVRPGPGGSHDQAEAQRDRDDQERVEHHGVVVELGPVVVPEEPEPWQPA